MARVTGRFLIVLTPDFNKHTTMKTVIPLVSLLCVFSSATAMAAGKETKQSLSIFCPVYAEGLKTIFIKTGEDSYHGVTLSTANVVDAEDALVTDGKVSLHGPTAGDNVYPVVATADVSATQQPLVLLAPVKAATGTAYEAKVVEADLSKFSLGSFQLVNLSPNPVRVTSGEQVIEIGAGAETLYKPKVAVGESMSVTIDHKTGDSWQLVSSAQWASRDDRRTLVCFLLDPVSKRMMIKSVPLREVAGK